MRTKPILTDHAKERLRERFPRISMREFKRALAAERLGDLDIRPGGSLHRKVYPRGKDGIQYTVTAVISDGGPDQQAGKRVVVTVWDPATIPEES